MCKGQDNFGGDMPPRIFIFYKVGVLSGVFFAASYQSVGVYCV